MIFKAHYIDTAGGGHWRTIAFADDLNHATRIARQWCRCGWRLLLVVAAYA